MSVAVIVPWHPTAARERVFEFVHERLALLHDWPVIEACWEPWSKPRAVNFAAERTDADVLVVCDADCLVSPLALNAAVSAVQEGAAWAVPHRLVYRLTYDVTAGVLQGPPSVHPGVLAPREVQRAPYEGLPGGGLFVVSRKAWETVGGFDPRFEGWGSEDASLGYALDTLAGLHVRGQVALWHLYHPQQDKTTAMDESQRLEARYLAANGDPEAMRALVAEHSP